MGRLEVSLSGWKIDNPIIPASGTFGYGKEYQQFYDINCLGTFSCKGTTKEERYGNELPRIADCTAGMINSVGLQNPGIDHVVEHELVELKSFYNKQIIANVSGFSLEEYVEVASKMDQQDVVALIEVNISCPNVKHGGLSFGTDPAQAAQVTKAVKAVCKKPVYVKLSPNVTDIVAIAKAVEEAGADGIVAINTLLGSRFDLKTGRPIIANIAGGFSGPAIKPVGLRAVYQIAKAVSIPIIGVGGIETAEDVIEYISAGATAVQIGAANLKDPYTCYNIIQQLPSVMDHYGIESIQSLIGRSLKYGK